MVYSLDIVYYGVNEMWEQFEGLLTEGRIFDLDCYSVDTNGEDDLDSVAVSRR